MSIIENVDVSYRSTISEEEVQAARERKSRHVYENFIDPVLEDMDSREIFQVNKVMDEIRPPYSYREVRNALEYGSRESDEVELLEEDMDLFLYAEE